MITRKLTYLCCMITLLLSACAASIQAAAQGLEGAEWVLTGLDESQPLEGTRPTLTFEDGEVSGVASCNHYGGSYEVKADTISFGALFSTEMACQEPEGAMEQERVYLEMLGDAQRYEIDGDVLTIVTGTQGKLTFVKQGANPAASAPTAELVSPVPDTPAAVIPTMTPAAAFELPAGFKAYQDSVVGVSVFLPESWSISGVIEGDYAIFQSYPKDKYIGGEPREPGDTKCDLNVHPAGTSVAKLIQKWKENIDTTILSEEEVVLQSGQPGMRLEMDNRGRSISMVTEINGRTVQLICFGEPEAFDEIALTMHAIEITNPLPADDWDVGIKQYLDTETDISINIPDDWVIVEMIPGQRVTLQTYSGGKYVGGELPDPEDTKCDLFFRDDTSADDFIQEMRSNEAITILSEDEITLNAGGMGTRIEIESMGRSVLVITELNSKTVVLTCYGKLTLVDEIASTLKAAE